MPKKPLRPCSHPGCPNLCEGQFCEPHRVGERRKYDKYERSSDVNRKYGRAWKRIRDRYAAEHPLCEMCLKEGRLTPGTGSSPHYARFQRRYSRKGQPHESVSVLPHQNPPRSRRPVGG